MSKRKYHHGGLREALVAATIAVVDREGVEGVTLRKVAQEVGVTAPAAYHHFPTKDHLLAAGAELGFQGLLQAFDACPARGDALERLVELGRAYVRYTTGNPALYRLMFGAHMRALDDIGDLAPSGVQARQRVQAAAAAAAAQLGEAADPERVFQVAWATVAGVCALVIEREAAAAMPEQEVEALADAALQVLVLGLRAWAGQGSAG